MRMQQQTFLAQSNEALTAFAKYLFFENPIPTKQHHSFFSKSFNSDFGINDIYLYPLTYPPHIFLTQLPNQQLKSLEFHPYQ